MFVVLTWLCRVVERRRRSLQEFERIKSEQRYLDERPPERYSSYLEGLWKSECEDLSRDAFAEYYVKYITDPKGPMDEESCRRRVKQYAPIWEVDPIGDEFVSYHELVHYGGGSFDKERDLRV